MKSYKLFLSMFAVLVITPLVGFAMSTDEARYRKDIAESDRDLGVREAQERYFRDALGLTPAQGNIWRDCYFGKLEYLERPISKFTYAQQDAFLKECITFAKTTATQGTIKPATTTTQTATPATTTTSVTTTTPRPAQSTHSVRGITGEPEIRRAGGDWVPLLPDMELRESDEIATDPDSTAVFVLADGSTVRVEPGSQIKISVLTDPTLHLRARLDVAFGRIAARFNPQQRDYVVRGDMVLRTPTATASVRGTVLSMVYDPKTRESLVSVEEGEVQVALVSDETKTVTLSEGMQVRSTASTLGTPEKNTIVSGLAESGTDSKKTMLVVGVLFVLLILGFVIRMRRK